MLARQHCKQLRIILATTLVFVLFELSCASRTTAARSSSLQGYQRYSAESAGAAKAVATYSFSNSYSSTIGLLQSSGSSFRWRALRQTTNCDNCAPNACVLSGTTGTFKCSACLNGYRPNRFTGACECPAGYYPTGSGSSSSCAVCPVGSYCPGTAADSNGAGIYACPTGMTTSARKSISQGSCVNAPGYYWNDNGTAWPCTTGTFSPGLRRQRTCNSCPSGYTTVQAALATNFTACVLSPGWYMTGPGSIARCPYGKYKEGYGSVSSCTSCPTGVTTDSAGKASASECKYLLPGYEASSVSGTQVLATAACRINAYCPGTNTAGDPGYVICPNQRWTVNISSTSPLQCMVPPGHSATSTTVTKCPSGYYKGSWTLTDTADCTYCGNGISTEDRLEIKRYNQNGQPSASVFVAGASASCYIPRGYEMVYTWDSTSNSYTYTGRPCTLSGQVCAVSLLGDGNLYSNRCNGYGVNETSYGLKVRPCRLCQGPVSKFSAPDLGFSVCSKCPSGLYSGASGFCEIPPGRATADSGGSIYMSAPSNTSLIASVVACPANYYCTGGPSPTTVPAACPLMGSLAGATSSSGCNQIAPGQAAANGAGTVFLSPPSDISLIQSLVSCPASYYCSGGLANSTAPTSCPLLSSLAGASSSDGCDQVPPGKAAVNALGEVFYAAPSNKNLIQSLVSCPANYYCAGGLATSAVPTPCGVLNSLAGASSSAECNQVPAGMASADNTGQAFYTAPGSLSLIKSLVSCPANYYCPGGTAPAVIPTVCPLLTSLAGASTSAACNLVPVGYAAANDTTVFSTTVSSISSITRLVACPQGFYCTGGDPTVIVPTPCNSYINTAGTGSTQLSDCNLAAPGYRLVSANTPEECTSGFYTSGWTSASSCTACGNGANWVSTQAFSVTVYIKSGNTRTTQTVSTRGDLSICLGPPGYYYDTGTNALIACPTGTYKSTYDRATSCTSCGASTSTAPRTSASDCGVVGIAIGASQNVFTSSGTLSAWNSNGASASYSSVSIDQSGKYAVVARSSASVSGHVWFSSNAGATWTQISTTSRTWVGVAINNAGNMVVAVSADNAQVWQATTTNGGSSWSWSSITSSSGQGPWVTVAISGSGNKVIAAASSSASSKRLWVGTSSDGVTYSWANALSGGSALTASGAWTGLAVADDGSYMAATQDSGHVYVSYDAGATFSVPSSGSGYPGSSSFYAVACNKNCTQLLVAKSGLLSLLNGQVWKGVYSSGSWTWTQPLSTLLGNWREVASSADGQTLVAGSQNAVVLSLTLGSIWVSNNGGSNWDQATLNPSTLGLLQGDWTGVAVNA